MIIKIFVCILLLKLSSLNAFFIGVFPIPDSPNKIAFMFLNAINSLIALHRRKFYIIYFFYLDKNEKKAKTKRYLYKYEKINFDSICKKIINFIFNERKYFPFDDCINDNGIINKKISKPIIN